jgi:hypothetical protein
LEVDIVLTDDAGLSIFAHELKHAYDFDIGKMSLTMYNGVEGKILGMLNWLTYDQQDEIDGYQRQGLFGSTKNWLPTYYTSRVSRDGITFPKNQMTIEQYIYENKYIPNETTLQRLSERANQAFRYQNTTYYPNKRYIP